MDENFHCTKYFMLKKSAIKFAFSINFVRVSSSTSRFFLFAPKANGGAGEKLEKKKKRMKELSKR
jgi:hypothetical protein